MKPNEQCLFFAGGKKYIIDSAEAAHSIATIEKDKTGTVKLKIEITLIQGIEKVILTHDELKNTYGDISNAQNFVYVQSMKVGTKDLEDNSLRKGSLNLSLNERNNVEMNFNVEIQGGKTEHG